MGDDVIKLGSVVMVSIKTTDKSGNVLPASGTVISLCKDSAAVLLPTGDIWHGHPKLIFPWQPTDST